MTAENSHTGDGGGEAGRDFERLVDACYVPLYRFALSLTRSETEAADLVQEAFHIWARKGHQLQEASKAKGWLFTTLHRRFLEAQRKRARFPQLELDAAAGELPAVDVDWVDRLDAGKALELLSRIDPRFRAAVAMFYLEDCEYEEIARVLEIPLGTVKSRIARGLLQLRGLVVEEARRVDAAGGRSR